MLLPTRRYVFRLDVEHFALLNRTPTCSRRHSSTNDLEYLAMLLPFWVVLSFVMISTSLVSRRNIFLLAIVTSLSRCSTHPSIVLSARARLRAVMCQAKSHPKHLSLCSDAATCLVLAIVIYHACGVSARLTYAYHRALYATCIHDIRGEHALHC